MALRYQTITFLSDYGRTDEFVGVVHSVIRSIAPDVAVVDLTHDIEPYDVRAGGLALARATPYLCPGVVIAVVDPSERSAAAGITGVARTTGAAFSAKCVRPVPCGIRMSLPSTIWSSSTTGRSRW